MPLPFFTSSYIADFQSSFKHFFSDLSLDNSEDFHILKSRFFAWFDTSSFQELYQALARDVMVSLYPLPHTNAIGLQRTPSPRIFFPNSHGTSLHTDYWYGHGRTAHTVWVPLINCVQGATFFLTILIYLIMSKTLIPS